MEDNVKNFSIVEKFPESEKINEELRDFANKQRNSVKNVSKSSSDLLNTSNVKSDNNDSNKGHESPPGNNGKEENRVSLLNSNTKKTNSYTLNKVKMKNSNYLEGWLLQRKKRNEEILEKYLQKNPLLSEYKREHIRKYGKPIFKANSKSYLLRKQLEITRYKF